MSKLNELKQTAQRYLDAGKPRPTDTSRVAAATVGVGYAVLALLEFLEGQTLTDNCQCSCDKPIPTQPPPKDTRPPKPPRPEKPPQPEKPPDAKN